MQPAAAAGTTDGPLRMEVITAYNLVVDSNIESPAGAGPSAAHLGVRITNQGSTPLTDVYVKAGDLLDAATGAGTAGDFPARANPQGYTGTFALQMPGGAADAVRYIPSLAPGASVVQYFFVTYPCKDNLGQSLAGAAPDTADDLWLDYDLWASANDGAATRRVDQTTTVTLRNEISASANKIWPNTDGKVPDDYLASITSQLGWRPDISTPRISGAVVMEGIWYDLGNVGAGFDNDGDGLPDRNAWLQPVGNPDKFSPLAARLVKCYGLVIVKLNDGTEQLVAFEDQLYFEKIPANNRGVVGLVYYEFLPLDTSKPSQLSPYQEVASGNDNEKFNADYGASVGSVSGTPLDVTFDKSGPASVIAGNAATYTLSAVNNDASRNFGWPELGLPLVFEDAIPANLIYVAGSATTANTPAPGESFTVTWSTDGGTTWVGTEPAAASVTAIRWTMSGTLTPGQSASVQFAATVPANYPGSTATNTGKLKKGANDTFATDSVTTKLQGINSVGNFVWRDLDRDGVQDGGTETGIANIGVSLYYDADHNGTLDPSDPLYDSTATNASGAYQFANVRDGDFIVVVDASDPDLPEGFSLAAATSPRIAVALDPAGTNPVAVDVLNADWPFIQALEVVKSVTPTTYQEGALVSYTIDLENHMSAVPPVSPPQQFAYVSSATQNTNGGNSKNPSDPTRLTGAPDNTYAFIDWEANADSITTTGLNTFPATSGTISKVEMVVRGYLSTQLTNDTLDISLGHSGAAPALFGNVSTSQLNALVGVPQVIELDITSKVSGTWTWAQAQSLRAVLAAAKEKAGDNGDFYIDSIGFRVTASTTSGGSYGPNTITHLPLVDTYDPAKLQYVSASVTPDATAPAGTLTWENLGPLNAGARRSITVVFRALAPVDTNADGRRDTTTATNTATSTDARFVDGRLAGSDTGAVDVTITPAGTIGDFVYWDLDGSGGFNTGDFPLAGVIVQLYQRTGANYLPTGATAITDANGFYQFTGLADAAAANAYQVRIVKEPTDDMFSLPWTTFSVTALPGGGSNADAAFVNGPDVVINNSDTVTTNDGNLLQDFGFDTTSSLISGKLFMDRDGDAIQDPGEEPLAGYTVRLTVGAATVDVLTQADGGYRFENLTTTGDHTVTVISPPAGTVQTLDPDATFDSNTVVNVSAGNAYIDRNFAYRPSGALSLGDTVYYDWNGNGTQDAGDEGIADVEIRLYEDANGDGSINPSEDALIASTSTNSTGVYGFSGLVAGSYIVVVVTTDPDFPIEQSPTQDYDGIRDGKAKVNLTASLGTVDFGFQPTGSAALGNLVWLDLDNNGLKDGGEPGIDGVTVQLYRATQTPGVDTPVAATTTSGGGSYGFSALPAGDYVVYLPGSNFASGGALAAVPMSSSTTVDADDAIDNDDNGIQGAAGGAVTSPSFGLTSSESDTTKDFGFIGVGSVGDFVFYDANGNGQQDYTETGIADVTVRIFVDVDNDGVADSPTPLATAVTADGSGTDPAGFYRFSNLAPGTYLVQVEAATLPADVVQTADPDLDGIPVNPPTYVGDHSDSHVVVNSGSSYSGADFGYRPPGAIGDFVWLDLDQDGVQDPGEPGLAGVTVHLTNGTTSLDVTTDFDGRWTAILANGAWTASLPAANFSIGGPLEDLAPSYDADGTASANAVAFVLTTGTVDLPQGNLGLDFGYKLNGSYSLAGTVAIHDTGVIGTADDLDDFFDDGADMDAGPNDETELPGVEVFLFSATGDLLGSTFTDAGGSYSFSGLPGGTYKVILDISGSPLDHAVLTTTTANNLNGATVTSTVTSATQELALTTASVANVDFTFNSTVVRDYGDLPVSYGATTLAQDGARHIIPSGGATVYLGTAQPDADTNGLPTANANGDDAYGSDDEDGIVPVSPATWTDATGGTIQATVNGNGWLVAWIDWNHDGDLLDAGEMIVSQAMVTGSSNLSFAIPAGTIGGTSQSWLGRFRLFASPPAYPIYSYTGEVTNGEVEDILIEKPVGGSIGDLVWQDLNANGAINAGEEGLGGCTIELRDGPTLVATQTTGDGTQDVDGDGVIDPVGYYRFRGVADGTYSVTVTNPLAGYNPSFDEDGIGTAHTITVVITSEAQHLTADFGYAPQTASISGQVRYDTDANGDPADLDTGALGIRIQLWSDPNGDGNPADGTQVGETYTDTSGFYQFTAIATGNYVVVETNAAGTTSTWDVAGTNDDRIAVSLAGTNVTGRDFLDTAPPLYAVSGTVYDDASATNDNVIGGDDTPLAGFTVELFFDRDGDGTVSAGDSQLASTATGASGTYSFANLTAGSYVVRKVNPAPAVNEWDAAGSLTDSQIAVAITGADVTDRNFLVDDYLGTVAGHLYLDLNGNGHQDGGEPNLANVDVTVTDANNVAQVVSTDSSGNWTATVPPGTTTADVDETDPQYPAGYAHTEGDDPTTVTAVGGTQVDGGIDGYYLNLDTDDDGIPDSMEIANGCPGRNGDTDGDGVPDQLDLDSDGDGIFDLVEAGLGALDANKDGRVDTTQGLNGLADAVETAPDSGVINYTIPDRDADGRPDYLDLDSDNDSISDLLESGNGAVVDLRVGGLLDGIADGTVNVDGIVSGTGAVLPVDTDGDLEPDFRDLDSDGDTMSDIVDNGFGSLDADHDGMIDNAASPADCDGIADVLDPKDDQYGWFPLMGCPDWSLNNAADTDGDVFPVDQEYAFGGDPLLGDHRVSGTTRRAGMAIEKNATGGIDISYIRPQGRFDVTVTPYVSDDPRVANNWTPVDALPMVTANGDGTDTVKWADIHDTDGNALVTRDRGFVRLKVETPCWPTGSWTLVQGWCRENISGKRQTYGVNFSSMPVFTGIVDSASGATLTLARSGKGQNLGVYLTGGATCYLEFTDGPAEGHRFNIASGGVDTFTLNLASLNNTTNALPSDLTNSHFVVRRHDTLGGIYPNAEWNASDSPGSADQVLLYSGTGYDTYYNYSSGVWVRQGGGFTSRNGLIIAPGTGMMVVHADPNDVNGMLAFGDLRYNDFRRPVKLGSTGLNFTALGYPFDATPASLNMMEANGFVSADSPGSATQILNWLGDTTVNATGWTTSFLYTPTSWRRVGSLGTVMNDAKLFRHCRSTHVDVQIDNLDWTHALPWLPVPWVQPAP